MTVLEKYELLRPFLRIENRSDRTVHRDARFEARTPFRVRCTELWNWGSYTGVLVWNPHHEEVTLRSYGGPVIAGLHQPPTFEQFCTWFGYDPAEGLT